MPEVFEAALDLHAQRLGHRTDLRVFGVNNMARDQGAGARGLDCVLEQRLASHGLDVFTWDTFGAAAGGSDGENGLHTVPLK